MLAGEGVDLLTDDDPQMFEEIGRPFQTSSKLAVAWRSSRVR